jgi:hypothetical protein
VPKSRENISRQRKLISLRSDILRAVTQYSSESGDRVDDIFEAAMLEYLKKMGQPVTLHEALKQSSKLTAANDSSPKAKRRRR